MPPLTPHAIPAGTLGGSGQPELRADGGLVLRPWAPADAPALAGLYADPAVQHWHGYAISTQDEALAAALLWLACLQCSAEKVGQVEVSPSPQPIWSAAARVK